MNQRFTKYQVATFIALLFHTIGLVGILFVKTDFFIESTVFNLLLMFALLVWTQKEKSTPFLFFFAAIFLFGIGFEVTVVNTASLFGKYHYGNVLSLKVMNVPIIIGINWFVIIYCCGISIHTLLMKAINHMAKDTEKKPMRLKALSVIIDGATLAVFFDWVMEPVAVKLGYWQWGEGGDVPGFNYFSWFLVSVLMLAIFQLSKFDKQNKFAVNLLLIQLMFFLLLRTFLL